MVMNKSARCGCATGLGVLAALAAAGARSSAAVPELEIITVVGKTPQPLSEVAATVSVITAEDLELRLAFDADDAFRNEPGLSVSRDPTRFGYTAITVRGLSGNRVLIESDGVPSPSTFAIGNFSNAGRQFTDPELVKRIEILKGPASTLYGSDAIAGVVATTTVDPADLLQPGADRAMRIRAGYASDSHAALAGMTAAARFDDFDAMLAFTRREGSELQNRYRVVDANPRDFEANSVLGRAVIRGLGQPLRLTLGWERQDAVTDVDSLELSAGRFANTIFLRGDDRVEAGRFAIDQVLLDAGSFDQVEWRLFRLETRFSQVTDEERRPVPPVIPPLAIDRDFRFNESVTGGEVLLARQFDSASGPHRLVGGAELTNSRTVERRDGLQTNLATGESTGTILGEVLPVRDFPISEVTKAGIFLQDEWRPRESFALIPALRADWYHLDPAIDAMYAADNPLQQPVSIHQQSLAPKLGASARISDDLLTYLQYSHGFRSQPFEDVNIGLDLPQFKVRAIPNPDLKPEKSDSVEIGLRLTGEAVRGSASVYYSRYRDFIESKVKIGEDPTGTILFQSQNLGRAEIQGAEATLEFNLEAWFAPLGGLSARLSGAWTRGDDLVRNQPINSVDPARAAIGLRFDAPSTRWLAQLTVTMVDDVHRVDESRGPLFQPSGYVTADLTGRWRISDRLKLNAGIFNLTDQGYYEWSDVRGRAPGDPLLELYRQPGRNASMTLTATF